MSTMGPVSRTLGPIYPVPVKPPSPITTWDGWPDDVRDTLRSWNGGRPGRLHRLSFRRSPTGSIFEPDQHVFKCAACNEFCATHPNGAAVLDEQWLCDDCLIAWARSDRGGGS